MYVLVSVEVLSQMDMFPVHDMVRNRRLVISAMGRHGAAVLISPPNDTMPPPRDRRVIQYR